MDKGEACSNISAFKNIVGGLIRHRPLHINTKTASESVGLLSVKTLYTYFRETNSFTRLGLLFTQKPPVSGRGHKTLDSTAVCPAVTVPVFFDVM